MYYAKVCKSAKQFPLTALMYANLTDDGGTHRTYSDDGLPWQNRRTTFWGFIIPLTVRQIFKRYLTCESLGRDHLR